MCLLSILYVSTTNYLQKMKNQLLFFLLLIFFLLFSCGEKKTPSTEQPKVVIDTIPQPTPESSPIITQPDYDTTQWLDLHELDSTIIIDMRYASTNNFVSEKMYDCGRCFLRPEAARAVVKVQKVLQEGGLGLKMFDCYRPLPVQQKLWDKFKNPSYVTPPSKGSMHNRGLATDLTIVDPHGKELEMGTEFDFFGKEAHHTYTNHSPKILANRKLLKETMASFGFGHIRTEWWHYSYRKTSAELSDMLWKCD